MRMRQKLTIYLFWIEKGIQIFFKPGSLRSEAKIASLSEIHEHSKWPTFRQCCTRGLIFSSDEEKLIWKNILTGVEFTYMNYGKQMRKGVDRAVRRQFTSAVGGARSRSCANRKLCGSLSGDGYDSKGSKRTSHVPNKCRFSYLLNRSFLKPLFFQIHCFRFASFQFNSLIFSQKHNLNKFCCSLMIFTDF